jgi:pyridoxamine 5'-phosphate oxidase
MIDYSGIRRDYSQNELGEDTVNSNPFLQFKTWFDEAIESKLFADVNAMALSSINSENKPSSRIVLLKQFDENGFVFFTNYESRKSNDMIANPNVSLLFFWDKLERQIRIEGTVEKTTIQESDDYFYSRPKESQIGAWASKQSKEITKDELQKKFEEYQTIYADKQVKRPEYWGGFRVIPSYFEFWQGRPSRLHDRIVYEKNESFWNIFRLQP